jgi:galactofuranose transport system permease protein
MSQTTAAPAPRYTTRRAIPTIVWPLLTLALLLLFNLVFTRGFFKVRVEQGHLFGSLIDILDNAAPVILVAFGMTLVIATRGVDLSVGAVMAIAGAIAATLLIDKGLGLTAALAISLAIALLAGLWNGLLVAVFGIQPIVATLILMVAGRGIAQLITRGQIPNTEQFRGFAFLGGGHFLGLPFSFTLVAGVWLITTALARLSAMGLFIEAAGNNPSAAHYAGVNVRLVKLFVYAFTGLCAGLAGLVATSDINAADANRVGLNLELDAILAVVIGGTSLAGGRFSIIGSVIGALIIQSLTATILARDVRPEYIQIVKAVVVLAVCLLQSPEFRAKVLPRRTHN